MADVHIQEPLVIEQITVHPDRLEVRVYVPLEENRRTNNALIEALLPHHPHLLDHACYNKSGTTFGATADHTSVPHLLEHLVVDYQVQWDTRESQAFTGTTHWLPYDQARACIYLSFVDDVTALAALKRAAVELNAAIRTLEPRKL